MYYIIINNKTKKEDTKMKKLTNEEAARKYNELKMKERRYTIKQKLMIRKAVQAGITVTEAEVDAELKLAADAV